MNRKSKLVVSFITGIALVVATSFAAYGGSDHDEKHHADEYKHDHSTQHKHEHGGDPLIEEMVALDAVFRDVVSGVAMSDGHRVHGALEKMHGTMEKTHEGMKHGSVTLKKNANRLNEFVEQDKIFHGKLEDLAKAAHKNDGNAMLALTKELLDGCVRCHRDFRQP
jgi:cytochrome c556